MTRCIETSRKDAIAYPEATNLGSGLIDHSQKMIAVAMQIAEK
jgi:hypothetical protein